MAGRLLLEIAVNKTHTREQNRNPSPETPASAHGAQMAKYFTMNQPPHVALDSVVSVVRPQMAITRLIARSGIRNELHPSHLKRPTLSRFI